MAKKLLESSSNSSLSPHPPSSLALATGNDSVEVSVNSRKRKAGAGIKTTKRAKKASVMDQNEESVVSSRRTISQPKKGAKKKVQVEEEIIEDEVRIEENERGSAVLKKSTNRKSKSVKTPESLAERTKDTKLRVGAHVSAAGGVHNAVLNVLSIGGNAFALFLKNQKKWENKDLDPEHAKLFIDWCEAHSITAADCCVPHGSYLVNLAHPDPDRKKQAYGSFVNDLIRCHTLGIKLYNFHPGNANATTREEGIRLIAENINQAHQDPATGGVITVLETMASLGNTIGGTFADLGAIISHVKDKSRVAVCLDTCHVFAAGYDLRSPEAYAVTMRKFDEEIGLNYLKAFHINDSKAPLSSHRDLHARIGTGYLGLRGFHNIMNDERFHGVPMILETPISIVGEDGKKIEDKSIWAREIKMLEKLVGMDVESKEFKELEYKLQEEGKHERERIGDQVERKKNKNLTPKKKRGKKKLESGDEDEMKE